MLTIITDNGLNRIKPSRVIEVTIDSNHIRIQEEILVMEMDQQTGAVRPVVNHFYTNFGKVPNQDKVLKKIIQLVEKKKSGTYRFTTKKKLEKVLKKNMKKVQEEEQKRSEKKKEQEKNQSKTQS